MTIAAPGQGQPFRSKRSHAQAVLTYHRPPPPSFQDDPSRWQGACFRVPHLSSATDKLETSGDGDYAGLRLLDRSFSHTRSNNFYLLSHVKLTICRDGLSIKLFFFPTPKVTIEFYCPAALAFAANLFDFPHILCSYPSGSAQSLRRRTDHCFTASFILLPHPPSPNLSRENRTWWSLRPDNCLDAVLPAPHRATNKYTQIHFTAQNCSVWKEVQLTNLYLPSYISSSLNGCWCRETSTFSGKECLKCWRFLVYVAPP